MASTSERRFDRLKIYMIKMKNHISGLVRRRLNNPLTNGTLAIKFVLGWSNLYSTEIYIRLYEEFNASASSIKYGIQKDRKKARRRCGGTV